ncbi:MAG: NnrU family protein [Woeseia sp.]
MVWLSIGVLFFMAVHLVPSAARGLRTSLVARIGENPYKGVFSLLLLAAIALIVIGWRSGVPQAVYLPPGWARPVTLVLMFVSVWLFGAANVKTRIKRYIRHPQLTGMALWSFAHLLANGDSRSLILFGGLGLWALIEMLLINRREGGWVKPDSPALSVEIRTVLISAVAFAVLLYLHRYFAGVAVIAF